MSDIYIFILFFSKRLDKKLKTWHTQNKICLVEADVPSTILPFGYTASLVDVRVKSRGPDDTIYKNNPEIRSMVRRKRNSLMLGIFSNMSWRF